MTAEETPATLWLKERGVKFERHVVEHVMQGKETLSESFSRQLRAEEFRVLKTMVLEDSDDKAAAPFVVVMHGNLKLDTKKIAKRGAVPSGHRVRLCPAERASGFTGYRFGGTSPFGLSRGSEMRIFAERTIAERIPPKETIWVNGGSGVLVVSMTCEDFLNVLKPTLIEASQS